MSLQTKDVVKELIQVYNPKEDLIKLEEYNKAEYTLYEEYENLIIELEEENLSKN
jgi:hypothetical protein